jgi:hypothetical protein
MIGPGITDLTNERGVNSALDVLRRLVEEIEQAATASWPADPRLLSLQELDLALQVRTSLTCCVVASSSNRQSSSTEP